MTDKEFYVMHEVRIDWSELDYFKHVNNVSVFKYIQSARVNYWDKIGLTQLHISENIGPMVKSVSCDFQKPLFFPGHVKILTRTKFIKNTSFGFEHQLLNETGEVVAVASDLMVMYDFNKSEKVAFPAQFRKLIEEIEHTKF